MWNRCTRTQHLDTTVDGLGKAFRSRIPGFGDSEAKFRSYSTAGEPFLLHSHLYVLQRTNPTWAPVATTFVVRSAKTLPALQPGKEHHSLGGTNCALGHCQGGNADVKSVMRQDAGAFKREALSRTSKLFLVLCSKVMVEVAARL